MRALPLAIVTALALTVAATRHAAAYPQYQLAREQTCGSCHLAPTGGGLLDDNGELTAEDDATWGGDPSFLQGAVTLPEWLRLGGDFRAAAGTADAGGGLAGAAFPMQAEFHGAITRGPLAVVADLGFTIPQDGGSPLTVLMSREHYVRWNQHDDNLGAYVRVGRFMPVYGLRQAEHPMYTRRYGATPLFGESYGVAAGWVSAGAEAHVTGFIHDRLRPNVADGDGAAIYVEQRIGTAAVGASARYAHADDHDRTEGGVTGKLWFDGPSLLLSGEVQAVHEAFDAGPARNQIIGNLLASWFVHRGYLLDVGVGHYDENVKVPDVDRDALEVNLHWFPKSHLELILMTRVQAIGFGRGGDGSGYALLQAHYRL